MTTDARAGWVPGQKVGPYLLLEKLGAGGLGEVWKARDARLNRVVALKFLSAAPGASSARELLREARAASALNHPNLVTIFEVGESEGVTYLAMEFIEGETLRARLKRPPVPLPVEEAAEIAAQVAAGLAAAHRAGIVHRDLKPENVMLRADGYVKLVDFGLAKRLPWSESETTDSTDMERLTRTGQLVGTFTYMSPEQARGFDLTPASDVFSCGIVLFELFTGEHPFRGETAMDTLNAILSKDAPNASERTPAVPPAVSEVVARALRKKPEERFPSGGELAMELQRARSARAAAPQPLPSAVRPKPLWMKVVGTVLLLGLLGWTGWSLLPGMRESSAEVAGQPAARSLAVMSFRVAADDPAAALIAETLPEDLGAGLSAAGLRVASRSSVLEAGATADPRALGAQLGVDAVLAGSVRSFGARFRVHAELVSTRTGFQIWSGTLTLEAQDPLAGEQKAAADLAAQIRAALAGQR